MVWAYNRLAVSNNGFLLNLKQNQYYMNTINFDVYKLQSLKTQYNKAIKDGKDSFIWNGNELLTSYAKYLIEYLNNNLKQK